MKDTESGVIIAGCENGKINVYSADKMLAGTEDCMNVQLDRHTGAVKALDINPFQVSKLLALQLFGCAVNVWLLGKAAAYEHVFRWKKYNILLFYRFPIFLNSMINGHM